MGALIAEGAWLAAQQLLLFVPHLEYLDCLGRSTRLCGCNCRLANG